jgi:CheY-like chemotaxis protein
MAKKILVVDDEADIVEFLTALLSDHGYDVSAARNGVEAMDRVREGPPALILLDLQMPEETGTGFYRKLRDRKELRDIPVIIVSGLAGRNVAVSRSVPVLEKPLDESVVLTAVRQALGERC